MKDYLERRGRGDDKRKDNMVYRMTRKILVATYQHIIYNEYLAKILGPEYMDEFNLHPGSSSSFSQYDEEVNPTISNEFATFAYRWNNEQPLIGYYIKLNPQIWSFSCQE